MLEGTFNRGQDSHETATRIAEEEARLNDSLGLFGNLLEMEQGPASWVTPAGQDLYKLVDGMAAGNYNE